MPVLYIILQDEQNFWKAIELCVGSGPILILRVIEMAINLASRVEE